MNYSKQAYIENKTGKQEQTSEQWNGDVNAVISIELNYAGVITQRSTTAVQAKQFLRQLLKFCHFFLKNMKKYYKLTIICCQS